MNTRMLGLGLTFVGVALFESARSILGLQIGLSMLSGWAIVYGIFMFLGGRP